VEAGELGYVPAMDHFDLLQRLAVAFGIGLLVGVERGWVDRNDPEGGRSVGMRTLALAGLLGGVVGLAAERHPLAGGMLLATAFLVYGLLISFFRYREMLQERTFGATTIIAALVVFALGVLAAMVDKSLAAAGGVATAALLALKPSLHAWLRRLTWEELRSGLVLLAMSVILLPVLPDRGFGPFQALNPHELWLMTILIAAVSAVGYAAIKIAGDRWGVLLSAVAGGLVSSTAVTLTFARLAHTHPEREPLLRAGVMFSSVTMMARVLIVAGIFNHDLIPWLAPPLVGSAIVFLIGGALLMQGREGGHGRHDLVLTSPFELVTVLKFGALLAIVMLASKSLTRIAGATGAYAIAAASGVADVDAITMSMARLGSAELRVEDAAGAILTAVAVASLTKSGLAAYAGDRTIGRRLAVAMTLGVAVGATVFAVMLLNA
jgi:uncharacterized membrane protein (DUF4010 family)